MTSGLANLIAKKANTDAAKLGGTDANDSKESNGVRESTSASASVSSAAATTAPESQRPKNPFGKRKDSGTPDSSGRPSEQPIASSGTGSSGGESRPKLASLSLGAGTQHTNSDAGSVAAPAIDSLDSLNESTDAGIAPRESLSHFSDETPAQKPTRELPDGLTKEQLGFVDLIDGVYSVMHEPDLLGGVIRNIIIELKENPEYIKLVAPDDVRSWVRGMRESMGLAKIKKQESKAKRSGGSGKKSKLVDLDMLNDLEDLGVSIPE